MKRKNSVFRNQFRRFGSLVSVAILLVVNTPQNVASAEVPIAPPPAAPASIRRGPTEVTIFKPQPKFSENPSDDEIITVRVFSERLTPLNGTVDPLENKALAAALSEYKKKNAPEDLTDLETFLENYPQSRWKPSLELNMANIRLETGYFSQAVALYKSCWEGAKESTSEDQKRLATEALAEFLLMSARLGRKDDLMKYLPVIDKRVLRGSTEEKIVGAKEGLMSMKLHPERAYRCGPHALRRMIRLMGKIGDGEILANAESTEKGTNMAQLSSWGKSCGANLQIAKRSPGAQLIVPSVVHWKVGHFGAVTAVYDGRYHIEDPTFERAGNLWLSTKAIDQESDGFFLVPSGSLPSGWVTVSQAEGSQIWGKGGGHIVDYPAMTDWDPRVPLCCGPPAPPFPPQGGGCGGGECFKRTAGGGGMATASAWSMQSTLNIKDTPVGYSPSVGPSMNFSLNYNHLEANQPVAPAFSTVGPDWSFAWVSYLTVDASRNVTVRVRGGGSETYNFVQPDNVKNPYTPQLVSQAVLARTGQNSYQRKMTNGSVEVFDQPDGTGRIFMTKVIDPQGNSATITYNGNFRVSTITDALGQATALTYLSNILSNDGYYKISQISDPFGRSASFTYDANSVHIVSITDVINLQSSFVYDPNSSFVQMMTTPYGVTSFSKYQPLKADGTYDGATGLRIVFPDQTFSMIENWKFSKCYTYFWDRHAAQLYPTDPADNNYDHCVTTRWMISQVETESTVPKTYKAPLESEITFSYLGEDDYEHGLYGLRTVGVNNRPTTISRTVDGGTQTYTFEYNDLGNVTKSIDPIGRTLSFIYDGNNIDVVEIRETKGTNYFLLAKAQYDNRHLPLITWDGSGQKTQYSYNEQGQTVFVTDANNKETTNTYTNNHLTQFDGPLPGSNDKITYSYDGYGRLYQVTDSEGYVVTYSYDNADRLISTTYPDGTTNQVIYDRLDAILEKDRIGRWSQSAFDEMQQLAFQVDPLGRKVNYEWCTCGSLISLEDSVGNRTLWNHDLEGRTTKKIYPDNTRCSYQYETNTSRLKSITDGLNQTTIYSYNLDDTISQVSHTNEINPTPDVTITWDQNYQRISTVQNSWGTITYSYNPFITNPFATATTGGGQLQSTSNNVITNSTITYSYDALGRRTNRSINGANNSISWVYDDMSRPVSETNALGTFTTSYVDQAAPGGDKGTTRIASITYPNSQVTSYKYFGNAGDQRLQQILNSSPSGTMLSQFDYAYDPAGQIVKWQQQQNGNSLVYNLDHDQAGQLIAAKAGSGAAIAPYGREYYYNYDSVANRTSVQNSSVDFLRIGGSKTTGDTLTVTVIDFGLSGGQKAVNYVVLPGDTLSTIAAGIAAAISADASLQGIGVNASATGTTVRLRSVSPSVTTYSKSTSGGATETLTFGIVGNGVETIVIGGSKATSDILTVTVKDSALPGGQQAVSYTVQASDTLQTIATGLKNAVNADTNLQTLGVTATSLSTTGFPAVVNINSTSSNVTNYYGSTSSNATETMSLSLNNNRPYVITVSGTVGTGHAITINVLDAALTGGVEPITYTTSGGDPTTVATGVKNAINANSNLQAIGVSATSSGAIITVQSNSSNLTSYRNSTNRGLPEKLVLAPKRTTTQTATIGGTITNNDVLTMTVFDSNLPGGSKTVNYTVNTALDTSLPLLASHFATEINQPVYGLSAIGVIASSTSSVVNLTSTSTDNTTYSQSTNAVATETITLGTSLGVTQASYNPTNELTSLTPGGAVKFQGLTTKSIEPISPTRLSSVSGQMISIATTPRNPSAFAWSTNPGATEVLVFGKNTSGQATLTVGGTGPTLHDMLSLQVYNDSLPGGQTTVNYEVQSSDVNFTALASHIASEVNQPSYGLSEIGVNASSSGSVITLAVSGTTFSKSTSVGATETITLGVNNNGSTTAVIGGTKTTGDVLTITLTDARLPGGSTSVNYTVLSGDTLTSIASGLVNALNVSLGSSSLSLVATNSVPFNFNWTQSFSADLPLSATKSTVNVTAADPVLGSTTTPYQESAIGSPQAILIYDFKGNLINDGTNTYQWNAEDRLTQITYPGSGNFSTFTYDGLGTLVKVVETQNSSVIATRQFWGTEERDSAGNITKKLFSQGEILSGVSYYFTKDHLGSIREMTGSTGTIQAQLLYEPFGRATRIQGSLLPDFQYAGYITHSRSGLNLTENRQYSAVLGRWLNRDPIEESGGLNLYSYVNNDPIGFTDPSGLTPMKDLFRYMKAICKSCDCVNVSQQTKCIQDAEHISAALEGVWKNRACGVPGNVNMTGDDVDGVNGYRCWDYVGYFFVAYMKAVNTAPYIWQSSFQFWENLGSTTEGRKVIRKRHWALRLYTKDIGKCSLIVDDGAFGYGQVHGPGYGAGLGYEPDVTPPWSPSYGKAQVWPQGWTWPGGWSW